MEDAEQLLYNGVVLNPVPAPAAKDAKTKTDVAYSGGMSMEGESCINIGQRKPIGSHGDSAKENELPQADFKDPQTSSDFFSDPGRNVRNPKPPSRESRDSKRQRTGSRAVSFEERNRKALADLALKKKKEKEVKENERKRRENYRKYLKAKITERAATKSLRTADSHDATNDTETSENVDSAAEVAKRVKNTAAFGRGVDKSKSEENLSQEELQAIRLQKAAKRKEFEARNRARLLALQEKNKNDKRIAEMKVEAEKRKRAEARHAAFCAGEEARKARDAEAQGHESKNVHTNSSAVGSAISAARVIRSTTSGAPNAPHSPSVVGLGNMKDPPPTDSSQETESKEAQVRSAAEARAKREAARATARRIEERRKKHLEALKAKRAADQSASNGDDERKARLRERLKSEMLALAKANRLEKEKLKVSEKEETISEEEAAKLKKEKIALEKSKLRSFMSRLGEAEQKRLNKLDIVISDRKKWEAQNGVANDQLVFIVTGFYPSLVKELKSRGWFHNEDRESMFFDLKWTIQSNHINHKELKAGQIVNHFSKASNIVTKVGLLRNLRSLQWFASVDPDTFFPRCYDVTMSHELEDFILDYKHIVALSILQKIADKAGVKALPHCSRPATQLGTARQRHSVRKARSNVASSPLMCKPLGETEPKSTDGKSDVSSDEDSSGDESSNTSDSDEGDMMDNLNKFAELWNDADETVLPNGLKNIAMMVATRSGPEHLQVNWSVFETALHIIETFVEAANIPVLNEINANQEDSCDDEDIEFTSPRITKSQWHHINPKTTDVFCAGEPAIDDSDVDDSIRKSGSSIRMFKAEDYTLRVLDDDNLFRIMIALDKYRCIPWCQPNLSGKISKNVWIVKPAGKSRGRGIQCLDDIDKILSLTKFKDGRCANDQWIIQKYIENPMIILGRKFDIRQWVLVTSL